MGAHRGGRPLTAIEPPARVSPGSLGVLGGTFDPIHHGHLAIAEEVRETLGLDAVWLVPARVPPHRSTAPGASPEHRAQMVALAVGDNPHFQLSRLELDRPGPSYTADTLAEIVSSRAQGSPDPVFILSGEALAGLPTWHEPSRVLALARLAVVPRAGVATPDRAWLAARVSGADDRVVWLDGPILPISGSVVRARARAGRSLRYLVPDAVARYIDDHGLYRSAFADAPPAAPPEDSPQ